MNIIETVKLMFNDCPRIEEFTNDIHIDFTENKLGGTGLYSNGDTLVKEDILGNQERMHTFVLRATYQSIDDYDRLANSTFLLEIAYWLEKQKGRQITVIIDGIEKQGKITKMGTANAMMYDVPTGVLEDGINYQIQVYATYSVET